MLRVDVVLAAVIALDVWRLDMQPRTQETSEENSKRSLSLYKAYENNFCPIEVRISRVLRPVLSMEQMCYMLSLIHVRLCCGRGLCRSPPDLACRLLLFRFRASRSASSFWSWCSPTYASTPHPAACWWRPC